MCISHMPVFGIHGKLKLKKKTCLRKFYLVKKLSIDIFNRPHKSFTLQIMSINFSSLSIFSYWNIVRNIPIMSLIFITFKNIK